jgi:hypothetical protein
MCLGAEPRLRAVALLAVLWSPSEVVVRAAREAGLDFNFRFGESRWRSRGRRLKGRR